MPDRDDRASSGKASKAKPVTTSYLADQLTRLESQFGAVSLDASGNPIVKRHPHDRTEIDADFPALGAEGQPGKKATGGPKYHGGEKHHLGGITDVRVVPGAVKAKPRKLSIGRIDDTDTASAQSPLNADMRLNGGDHGRRDRRAGDQGRGNNTRDGREHDRGARRKHKKGEYGDEGTAKKPWRAVVVDSSALMWSPQAVRRLVGHGWEVVVPLEALHTLDLLKTGSSPSARAARSATRYIEHASRHHKVSNHGTHKQGRGLRLQRDDETCPPDTISTLPVPMLDEEGLPPWMERILGCAAFFLKLAHKDKPQTPSIPSNPDDASQTLGDDGLGGEDAQTQDEVRSMDLEFDPEEDDDSGAVLFVANPPLNVEVRQGETTGIDERAEGYLISQEATRFEITLEVLRDEEEELEEHGDNARRGGGGGRGRNGNANGRGKNGVDGRRRKEKDEESDEREVRILLRRPTEAEGQKENNGPQGQGSTSPGIPAPLLSSPSTAARSPLPANGIVAPLEGPAMSPRPTSRHPPPGPPLFPHPPPPPRGHGPSRGHPPGHHHHPSPHRGRRPDDQSDSASDISARGKGDLSRRGRDGRGRGRGRGRGGGEVPGRGRGGGGGRGGMRTGGEFVPLQRPTRQDDRTNGVRRDVDARDARDARDCRDGRPAGGAARESDRPKVVLLQRPR